MALVVFLKGVNVGGYRRFRPSLLARTLARYGVINVGAAGTFVVMKHVGQAKLRSELLGRLPFASEIMICSAREIIGLASAELFAGEAFGPGIVRFVSVLARRPQMVLPVPLWLPSRRNWLVKLIELRGRLVLGLYRRKMRTIGALGQLEKRLGGAATTRNWNTIEQIVGILQSHAKESNHR